MLRLSLFLAGVKQSIITVTIPPVKLHDLPTQLDGFSPSKKNLEP